MYGRAGDLAKLNADRNNLHLPDIARLRADKAHAAIMEQLKDKKLMSMRERLINATRAGDQYEARRIELAMKAYRKEDRETGT